SETERLPNVPVCCRSLVWRAGNQTQYVGIVGIAGCKSRLNTAAIGLLGTSTYKEVQSEAQISACVQSLLPQRYHRIDLHGASRREIAGCGRDRDQQQ